ncbi:SDR family oxidoreductase [Neobacillus ginsengisoli]|uniref:NAD(P)-dependent dehydrogenase (Short-subunit alcohol dehydrogenase family) n=1 Tax=Neobacillus ginsengisoli TaxID=904295 RepID=A0ABT9XX35_9BACI|nr:SDR family oxidoreductase [Neobacillus ginsengisoli]MDQ0200135.1 NAD(P)-dependent dehydrogenase (short-subunit alcohol dehydrogenase family) [Neobacillus ginsengisoli]
MSRKTAIVTGSSSGFGLLCVIELAVKGYQVIATMRNLNKSAPLLAMAKDQNVSDLIDIQPLDVTLTESILELKNYLTRISSIDVLVNNAGLAVGGFSEELSVEAYRKQFETNFFGVIAVTQMVLPFMRANGQGRIINISSISGRMGFPGLSAYTSSKFALEGFSESLRLEVKPFGIDVMLVEPGSYETNIWSSIETINNDQESPYLPYMTALLNEIESRKAEHGDPQDVAKLVAQIAAQTKSPDLRYPIGKGVKKNLFLKNMLPWKMIERVILKQIK